MTFDKKWVCNMKCRLGVLSMNSRTMRIGAPPPRSSGGGGGVSHVTWKTVANHKDVPRFLADAYAAAKAGTLSSVQLRDARSYLEALTGKNGLLAPFDNPAAVLYTLFERVNEAMVNAAYVVGQVLMQTPGTTALETLFFIFSYITESVHHKGDARLYLHSAAADMSAYLSALLGAAAATVYDIRTDIRKQPHEVVAWFAAMLVSNVHLVHASMAALFGIVQETLSHRVREIITLCEPALQMLDMESPLEETIKTAREYVSTPTTSPTTRSRLQSALEELQRVQTKYSSSRRGMDPGLVSALMAQLYRGDSNIDDRLVELIVWARFAVTPDELFGDLEAAISLLTGELWQCLAENATTSAYRDQLKADIARIEGGWDWLWGGSGKKSSGGGGDDKKAKPNDNDKGKEEATAADEFERRERERLRMEKLRSEMREQIAQSKGVRGPYDLSLHTVADREARIVALQAELAVALEDLQNERMRMQMLTMNVQNDNNALMVAAHSASIQRFAAMPNPEQQAIQTMRRLERMGSELETAVTRSLADAQERVDQLQYEIGVLQAGVRHQNKRVWGRTFNLGMFLLLLCMAGFIIYYLYKFDASIMKLTYDPVLSNIVSTARDSGTSSFADIWIREWRSGSAWNMRLEPLTPTVINNHISNAIVRLNNYAPDVSVWSRDTLLSIIREYQTFTNNYFGGLTGSISDVQVFMRKLLESGASVDSAPYRAHELLLEVLKKAEALQRTAVQIPTIDPESASGVFKQLMQERLIAIQTAAHHMAVAFQALQTKLWTGSLGDIASPESALMKILKMLPQTTLGAITGAAAGVGGWWYGRVPNAGTLNPQGLFNVMGAPGGRSEAWLATLDALGKGAISLAVGSFGIIMITTFSLSNYFAQLTVGQVNPLTYTMQMIPSTISMLKVIWDIIFTDVAGAARAQNDLLWTSILPFAALALLLFPQFAVLSRLKDFVANRIPVRYGGNRAPAQEAQPAALPAPPVPQQQAPTVPPTEPSLRRIEPPAPSPQFYAPLQPLAAPTPEQRPVPILINASDPLTTPIVPPAAMPAMNAEARARLAAEKARRRKEARELETSIVAGAVCSVCAQPATLACEHCDHKIYCDVVCARSDWSAASRSHHYRHGK